jgi:hypothetical protein
VQEILRSLESIAKVGINKDIDLEGVEGKNEV